MERRPQGQEVFRLSNYSSWVFLSWVAGWCDSWGYDQSIRYRGIEEPASPEGSETWHSRDFEQITSTWPFWSGILVEDRWTRPRQVLGSSVQSRWIICKLGWQACSSEAGPKSCLWTQWGSWGRLEPSGLSKSFEDWSRGCRCNFVKVWRCSVSCGDGRHERPALQRLWIGGRKVSALSAFRI